MKRAEMIARKWAKIFLQMNPDVGKSSVAVAIPRDLRGKAYDELRQTRNFDDLARYAALNEEDTDTEDLKALRLTWAMDDLLNKAVEDATGSGSTATDFMNLIAETHRLHA